ncbi:PHP domain-like protein [Cyathus striatus]|nr:PHP domain-like protein [Cyathus striatus]
MFFDLNVPVPLLSKHPGQAVSKKGKGKHPTVPETAYTQAQISAIEAHVDLLVHLGYSVIAFSHSVHKKVDSKTHVNVLDSLLPKLKQRPGIIFLKRLNIVLDEDSEKGFGLINSNVPLFGNYDLIALVPTNQATFTLACLTHTLPSALTAHIISLPLTLPRLNFHLKHTLVRTALKNGGVFEINYVGALGGGQDVVLSDASAAESGASAKRNWWAAAREVVRVTKGKGLLISGGVVSDADLRAPRDVMNLISMLGIPQDIAHNAATKEPKSLIVRAQTRKTYRAVFSEPKIVIPGHQHSALDDIKVDSTSQSKQPSQNSIPPPAANSKKRNLEDAADVSKCDTVSVIENESSGKKKKRIKNKDGNGPA